MNNNVKTSAKVAGLAALCITAAGCVGTIMMGAAPYSKDPRAGASMYGVGNSLSRQEAAERGRSRNDDGDVWEAAEDPTTLIRGTDGVVYKIRNKDIRGYEAKGYIFPAKANTDDIKRQGGTFPRLPDLD